MPNGNDRLAGELFRWELVSAYCDGPLYWFDIERVLQCSESDWHPDIDDTQAQMVVREVAKRGYRWETRTYRSGEHGGLRYNIYLFGPLANHTVYEELSTTNRNLHIRNAAIAALDAKKPEPHKCEKMPKGSYWLEKDHGWDLHSERQSPSTHRGSTHCSFCGADLNEKPSC